MQVVILPNAKSIAAVTADAVEGLVRRRPDAVLGLAAGSSVAPIYDELAGRCADGRISFARARGFGLDEYLGLPSGHVQSFREVIRAQFTSRVDIDPANVHVPDGSGADISAACRDFEAAIEAAGGVDLQLLGLGTNGHIGFNEPGSSLSSRTRAKSLLEQTRRDNARFFDGGIGEVPRRVITQGLGTIMGARHVILVATGAQKAQAAHDLIEGPVAAVCPASILQFHPHLSVLLDTGAASGLKRTEYYRHNADGGLGGPDL